MTPSVTAFNRPEIHCAWRGPALVVTDHRGRIDSHNLTGFWFRETRYLSALALLINGEDPFDCSVAEVDSNQIEFTFIYPPVDVGAGGGSGSGGQSEWQGVLRRGLDMRLRYEVHPSWFEVILWVTCRWNEEAEVSLTWSVAADYADVPEAQSGKRERQAAIRTVPRASGVRFINQDAQLPFETHLAVAGGGDEWHYADGRLSARIHLPRQSTTEVRLRVLAHDPPDPLPPEEAGRRELRLDEWQRSVAVLNAPGEAPIAKLTNRSVRELGSLALLEGTEDEWLTLSAGAPLYIGLWGRDALTAAWQACVFDKGQLARDALNRIGRMQGTRSDPELDEEPGRIIQQARKGPLDRIGKSPFARYYADYASPFDFIFALAHAYACSGDKELLDSHWDRLRRIMDWARDNGDLDRDGYLEYLTRSPKGPRHQGWKDSDNATVYEDGRQVEPPLAACEVQGYYFAAMQVMAVLCVIKGEYGEARDFWSSAKELKRRFNQDFWMPDEGCVALALDRDKRQVRSPTSDAGQCLATGIISGEHAPRLAARLFERDLFSGWGIRTLSTKNPAYNPLDYHLGSVWLVENATIVFGLRRFGLNDRALELARALYDLALLWKNWRVPECVGGYARDEFAHPGAYPRANPAQAWNLSAWPLIVQCILGLQPLAPAELLAVDPVLPPWIPSLTMKNLRIGAATVTLRFERNSDGETSVDVLEKTGTLHIVRQPPLESLTAGIWDRLRALVSEPLGV